MIHTANNYVGMSHFTKLSQEVFQSPQKKKKKILVYVTFMPKPSCNQLCLTGVNDKATS